MRAILLAIATVVIVLGATSGVFAKSEAECRVESFSKYPQGTLSKKSNARETYIAQCMAGSARTKPVVSGDSKEAWFSRCRARGFTQDQCEVGYVRAQARR